ncbi:MAG: DUF6152 family protein [Pseudomonadota bacterium]|nr:DUF6152 family protein [Pseudomonadota bacterium]
MKAVKTLCASLALSVVAAATFAHHSTNGIYDEERELELTGKVISWKFINPHPTLKLEVVNEQGVAEEWDLSYGGSAVTHLVRRGYSADTFKPGDMIKATGHPALLEGARGLLMEGTGDPVKADGTPIIQR